MLANNDEPEIDVGKNLAARLFKAITRSGSDRSLRCSRFALLMRTLTSKFQVLD